MSISTAYAACILERNVQEKTVSTINYLNSQSEHQATPVTCSNNFDLLKNVRVQIKGVIMSWCKYQGLKAGILIYFLIYISVEFKTKVSVYSNS